ncbi:MAG TPA: hypothetical protein VIY47_17410, partial [Ignavibacteriaceae bacterium]
SRPDGKLNYKRKVTVKDLTRFLNGKSDFEPEVIEKAIQTVVSKKGGDPGAAETPAGTEPEAKTPEQIRKEKQAAAMAKIDATATPVNSPEEKSPEQIRKEKQAAAMAKINAPTAPPKKPRVKYKDVIKEEIKDVAPLSLDEKDVEEIFNILGGNSSSDEGPGEKKSKKKSKEKPDDVELSPEEDAERKARDIGKIKQMVRDTMTAAQRKSLWRILSDTELSEAQVNRADVKAILQGATDLKNKSGIMGRMLGLKKDKIDLSDLQKAWAEGDSAEGIESYSSDTRDIYAILKDKFGFGDKEIKKVFAQVFGDAHNDKEGYDAPVASPAIQKIANYARKNGFDDVLKSFIEKEFGEELGLKSKKGFFESRASIENVRDVFTAMIQEERTERHNLLRNIEYTQLGRSKK